jgi:hypothetical protein
MCNLICGKNESCFEPGKHWGHFEGVMCKFLEDNKESSFICKKINKEIKFTNTYMSKGEYEDLIDDRMRKSTMFEEIVENINERIKNQRDSRCATSDEVRICWLVGEIERLQKIIKKTS